MMGSRRTRGDRKGNSKPSRSKKAYCAVKPNPQQRLLDRIYQRICRRCENLFYTPCRNGKVCDGCRKDFKKS